MIWQWLNKIVRKIAAEVHKSEIEETKKRMLAIEQKQEVILKTIRDLETILDKLDDRIYEANLDLAKVIGMIETLKELAIQKEKLLAKRIRRNEKPGNK